jgi:cytochrome c oxidase subunit 3
MAQVVNGDFYQEVEGKRIVSSIAMTIILISFSMLFATLFLAYAAYRFTIETWPPMGIQRPDLALPLLSTFLIALSSLVYWRFEKRYLSTEGNANNALWLVLILGVAFVGSQFALWNSLENQGLLLSTGGIFSSIVYAFTWIHAAHMLAGVLLLAWLLISLRGDSAAGVFTLRVQNVGKFWHFLGLIWLLMFFTIFVF